MKIGQLAGQTDLTTKTIRYYEDIGLVPEPPRTSGGYRDYGHDSVDRLRFIKQAQASGLTLAEVASILDLKDAGAHSCEHSRKLLRRHLEEVDAQIEDLRRTRDELATLAEQADGLDPQSCTDPNRCQVIAGAAPA